MEKIDFTNNLHSQLFLDGILSLHTIVTLHQVEIDTQAWAIYYRLPKNKASASQGRVGKLYLRFYFLGHNTRIQYRIWHTCLQQDLKYPRRQQCYVSKIYLMKLSCWVLFVCLSQSSYQAKILFYELLWRILFGQHIIVVSS